MDRAERILNPVSKQGGKNHLKPEYKPFTPDEAHLVLLWYPKSASREVGLEAGVCACVSCLVGEEGEAPEGPELGW